METLTLLNQASFWLFAALMIGGALGVVFHRSIVYSALFLLLSFLSIAAFFVMLNAPFIAAAQVLVYAVGLTIVLIFGIMLTGDQPFKDPVGQERPKRYMIVPGIIAATFLGFLTWALLYPNFQLTTIRGLFIPRVDAEGSLEGLMGLQAVVADGGVSHIGQLLFSKYLLPFELASVLLLLAMVGAIILSKRQFPEEEGEAALPGTQNLRDELEGTAEGAEVSSLGETSLQSEKEVLGVH